MKHGFFARWQANFWAGLVVILPALLSFGVMLWLFGTVANITDTLLIFLPKRVTHSQAGAGPMYWYWSLAALLLAIFLVALIGLLARNYFGKRIILWVEGAILRVPLVNKIYAAIKQVNDAFSTNNKTAFRTVVLVEFPHPGSYTLGFLTNDQPLEMQAKTGRKVVCVFMPTTPNPTSGFLMLVPQERVIALDMSVADGIKYVISVGSITPEYMASVRVPVDSTEEFSLPKNG